MHVDRYTVQTVFSSNIRIQTQLTQTCMYIFWTKKRSLNVSFCPFGPCCDPLMYRDPQTRKHLTEHPPFRVSKWQIGKGAETAVGISHSVSCTRFAQTDRRTHTHKHTHMQTLTRRQGDTSPSSSSSDYVGKRESGNEDQRFGWKWWRKMKC